MTTYTVIGIRFEHYLSDRNKPLEKSSIVWNMCEI